MRSYSLLLLLLLMPLVQGATLQGTIYSIDLEPEKNTLVEVYNQDKIVVGKYLAQQGTFTFELPEGTYNITASKQGLSTSERIHLKSDNAYVYDLFLLPGTEDEENLWQESEENYFIDVFTPQTHPYTYLILAAIVAYGMYRIVKVRKKYGSLWSFRKKIQQEQRKTLEEHKADIEREPAYIERVTAIIQKHDGRIHQKELRREMLDLSEAKISLILSDLEHKGKIEKVKKGRGNVILWKADIKEDNLSP